MRVKTSSRSPFLPSAFLSSWTAIFFRYSYTPTCTRDFNVSSSSQTHSCVRSCVYACICMCVHMCEEARGQPRFLLLRHCPRWFMRLCLSLPWDSPICLGWLDNQHTAFLSLSPRHWDCKLIVSHQDCYVDLYDQTQARHLLSLI